MDKDAPKRVAEAMTEYFLATLEVKTVKEWLTANGWARRLWLRDGGTVWWRQRGCFRDELTVPHDETIEAKRALVEAVAKWHSSGCGFHGVLAALLRQQEATHATD